MFLRLWGLCLKRELVLVSSSEEAVMESLREVVEETVICLVAGGGEEFGLGVRVPCGGCGA